MGEVVRIVEVAESSIRAHYARGIKESASAQKKLARGQRDIPKRTKGDKESAPYRQPRLQTPIGGRVRVNCLSCLCVLLCLEIPKAALLLYLDWSFLDIAASGLIERSRTGWSSGITVRTGIQRGRPVHRGGREQDAKDEHVRGIPKLCTLLPNL